MYLITGLTFQYLLCVYWSYVVSKMVGQPVGVLQADEVPALGGVRQLGGERFVPVLAHRHAVQRVALGAEHVRKLQQLLLDLQRHLHSNC